MKQRRGKRRKEAGRQASKRRCSCLVSPYLAADPLCACLEDVVEDLRGAEECLEPCMIASGGCQVGPFFWVGACGWCLMITNRY